MGDGEVGMKGRAVALVDAVRTLMRSEFRLPNSQLELLTNPARLRAVPLIPINIVVIVYEIIFGTGF